MRLAAFAAILVSTTVLNGCAGTVAGVTLSSISSYAGFVSTIFTGADLGEHAASLVTGKDCRFSEGLMRDDRNICEVRGSAATRNDFHGIFVERIDADGTVVYAAPKYMSASAGAGENENNTDVVWAQIKLQKAQEEAQRQFARAESAQQIDVAALADTSLPTQSLGFMPTGVNAASEDIEGETASQTAARPRPVANAARAMNTAPQPIAEQDLPLEAEQPAIDESSFTAAMQMASATGEGGPFIATATNSIPVVSKLVNGEPVVVIRIGPVMNQVAPSANEPAPVFVEPEPRDVVPAVSPIASVSEPVSPQAIVSSLPKANRPIPVERAKRTVAVAEVAAVEVPVSRPRTKPAVTALAAPKPVKPAKVAPAVVGPTPAAVPVEDDVYQPPTRDVLSSPAPDISGSSDSMPVYSPPAPVTTSESTATSGPAPLIPMAQP